MSHLPYAWSLAPRGFFTGLESSVRTATPTGLTEEKFWYGSLVIFLLEIIYSDLTLEKKNLKLFPKLGESSLGSLFWGKF